jgi:hypothetical protein
MISLPVLNGERAFMRPQIAFTDKYILLIAASEDNNSNNGNPKPVAFLADKTGKLVAIKNSTRGANINKPTDLIEQALRDGILVNNPNNQRGPHSIAQVPGTSNSFVVGMQYNNQAQEAFRVTVADDASLKVEWLNRYSNTARHCRPMVAINETTKDGFITAVEANNQPAEIGFRLTKFNVDTGKTIATRIAVRSAPEKRLFVAEPVIGVVGDSIAIQYAMTNARQKNNTDGHGNTGAQLSTVALFKQSDLSMAGQPLLGAAQFSRHAHLFTTSYGPNNEPAVAVISGSSDGQGGGFEQIIPIKADGTLGLKDPGKAYKVAVYADTANVQARGKRNPNNQAKGFINGMGFVPNPGYTTDAAKAAANFMPEVKTLSFSTITGYSSPEAALKGIKNSIWLSLVPGGWQEGLKTTPGTPTSTPGTNTDGTGPAPRTTDPATNPSGESTTETGSVIPEGNDPSPSGGGSRAALGQENGGCAVVPVSGSAGQGTAGSGGVALALLGLVALARRNGKRDGKRSGKSDKNGEV